VRLRPAGGGDATPAGTSLADWGAVSRWYSALSEPSAAVTPALSAHAASVVGAMADARGRTALLARDVQAVRYVEISLDLLRGGGHRPREAGRVLAAGYGDCKDKANLLRTLLRAEGLPAWMVLINASDAGETRDSTATPWSFDHCIVAFPAVATDDPTTVVRHPQLGNLILFDPTAPLVPFGELPESDRGRFALVVAGDSGCVLRTPDASPDSERIERTIDCRLDTDGGLSGTWTERTAGSRAVALTDRRDSEGERTVTKRFERVLASVVGGVSLRAVGGASKFYGSRTYQQFAFEAERAVQSLTADRTLLRVGPLPAPALPSIGATHRTLPVRLDPQAIRERWRVVLPAGWRAEAVPAPVHDSTAFGVATATWTTADTVLVLERALRVDHADIPATRWAEVRSFVEAANDAAGAGVVITSAPMPALAPAVPAAPAAAAHAPHRRHG
jgi:hypothetical protein